MDSRLIVGLGNIGEKYDFTRHNVGFFFLDKVAEFYKVEFKDSYKSFVSCFSVDSVKVHVVKPTTYMNNSGTCVKYWKDWLNIDNSDILILSDDLHLGLGDLRFRKSGSSGGHNGLKDIESKIGSDYWRLKIGIGNDYKYGDQANFVLSKLSDSELSVISNDVNVVLEFVDGFIKITDVDERTKKLNNVLSRGVISSVGRAFL